MVITYAVSICELTNKLITVTGNRMGNIRLAQVNKFLTYQPGWWWALPMLGIEAQVLAGVKSPNARILGRYTNPSNREYTICSLVVYDEQLHTYSIESLCLLSFVS